MNWEETVIKMKWMTKDVQDDQDRLLLKQAEITGNIAYKKGIREVLDAIGYEPNSSAFYVNPEKWEAQLKEWEVNSA